MKPNFTKAMVYAVLPIYFSIFIFSNIQSALKYFDSKNKWAPKTSNGPLLYHIAFTNPSRFSIDNKLELLALYYTHGKEIMTNSYSGIGHLSLYYRIACDLSHEGEIHYNGYRYSCPDMSIDTNLNKAKLTCSDNSLASYGNNEIVLCNKGLAESQGINLIIEGESLYLFANN